MPIPRERQSGQFSDRQVRLVDRTRLPWRPVVQSGMDEHGGHGRWGWTDVAPGLLILAAMLVISMVTFFGDAIRRATAEGPRLTILAPEVAGLERGSAIWLAGKPSGRVLGVHFREPGGPMGERVSIEAVMLWEAMPFLRADARVTVGAAALLAPAVVKIGPGSGHSLPLGDGDTLRVTSKLDIERFRTMADSVRTAIADVAEGAALLGEQITSGSGSATRFLTHRGSVAQLDSTRSRIDRLRLAWRRGGGLSRLVREDSARAAANRALATLRELADPANRPGVMDSLARAGETRRQIEERAREIGSGIERAEGTAGRAVQDRALRLSAQRTRAVLDSLTAELGANPLAWLRFELF